MGFSDAFLKSITVEIRDIRVEGRSDIVMVYTTEGADPRDIVDIVIEESLE